MATTIWRNCVSIRNKLRKQPWRFEFFEAVRVLHLIRKVAEPDSDKTKSPLERLVTYRTHLSLNFPASEIQDFEDNGFGHSEGEAPKPAKMTVNFMGLTGPLGVLPRHYTEFLLSRRIRFKDETAHRFFDLFNHRVISLFVQAWEKYRFYIGYERGYSENTLRYLLDLVGLGTTGLQGRLLQSEQGVRDEMPAYYSGLNSQRPHSAAALKAILQDYFGVRVEICQFQKQWLEMEPDQCTRIGKKGVYHQLGESVVVGDRVSDYQGKFRVRLGPLNKARFDAFLPIGNALIGLKKYVIWYMAPGQSFDVQLILRKEEVPGCRLGVEGASRLGWSTWLNGRPFALDTDDTILNG